MQYTLSLKKVAFNTKTKPQNLGERFGGRLKILGGRKFMPIAHARVA
jgi:hypothetical protein